MLYISIVVLLLLSAFFSASETAISTHNKIRLKKRAEDGDADAKTAVALSERYDRTITTILVGNNLVNISASTVMTLVCTGIWKTYGPLIATISTTTMVLVFGEILPKSLAAAHADTLALRVAKPLRMISILLTPVSFLFGKLQNAFHARAGQEEKTPTMTEEELLYFIESIEEEGVLEEEESNLVQSALEFDEITLREIVTPRVNLVSLDADGTREETEALILGANHSRVPVYEGSVDNIIGVLFLRDALRYMARGEEIPLRSLLEEAYFVHKGMKLSALLSVFQSRKVRMAIVLDEYGGTFGIVTLVDLLEELVGDFYDDEEPEFLREIDGAQIEITGGYDLWDMFEALNIDEDDQDSGFSTVSGWAMDLIGHIPEEGESFSAEGYMFTVQEMGERRIKRLIARHIEPVGPGGEDSLPGKETEAGSPQ